MISKKELLKEMNISYGQLYRWKREGLIPDEWFIKQAVSTGQETYFKRENIIPRIEKILELKDKYQLEELHNFLSTNQHEKKFTIKEIIHIPLLNPYIIKKYLHERQDLGMYDLAIIYFFSKHYKKINYDDYQDFNFDDLKNIDNAFYIINNRSLFQNQYYLLVGSKNMLIDKKFNVAVKETFEDIIANIAIEI